MKSIHKKKKKTLPRFLFLLLPLFLLGCCVLLYFLLPFHSSEPLFPPSQMDQEASSLIFTCSESELDTIHICIRDDEPYTLYYHDGDLWLENDPLYPVQQDLLFNTVAYSTYLETIEPVCSPEDGSDCSPFIYGLDPGACTVTITCKDGTSITFTLGDAVPGDIDTCYYMKTASSDVIYLVSGDLYDSFTYKKHMLHIVDRPDLIPARINSVSCSGRTSFTLYKTEGGWNISAPSPYPADTDTCETFINKLGDIRFSSYVGLAKEADLAAFGLDQPLLTYEFYCLSASGPDQETHTLSIGKDFNTVSFYCCYDGTIYVGTYFTLGYLTEADPERFYALNPVNIPIKTLKEIIWISSEETADYEVSLDERILPNGSIAVDENTGARIYDIHVLRSGQPVDSDTFLIWYNRLTQVCVSGITDSPVHVSSSDSEQLHIVLRYENEERNIIFSVLDELRTLVTVDGTSHFYIRSDWQSALPELP